MQTQDLLLDPAIQDMLEESRKWHAAGVPAKDGKCVRCGQCCSDQLPITRAEINRIQRYIKKQHIKPCHHFSVLDVRTRGGQIDLVCPFRDHEHKTCTIYAIRPFICRDYQCDKMAAGELPDFDKIGLEEFRIISMWQTFFAKPSQSPSAHL